ncbi:MAG: hypothetical protein FWF38_05355 [Spirochaetaceae bacterium]|nr:hypothetical protein [Spirochaetaceae bacterium]
MENQENLSKYIDIDAALSRVRGNKAIYKKMLGLFLKNNSFADLENTISQQDYPKASEVAHGIKGLTGNLGMNILFEESSKLMVQMRSGAPDEQTLKNYREALTKTCEYAEKLVAELV